MPRNLSDYVPQPTRILRSGAPLYRSYNEPSAQSGEFRYALMGLDNYADECEDDYCR